MGCDVCHPDKGNDDQYHPQQIATIQPSKIIDIRPIQSLQPLPKDNDSAQHLIVNQQLLAVSHRSANELASGSLNQANESNLYNQPASGDPRDELTRSKIQASSISKSQFKSYRAAIVLEALIKFDSVMRQGPLLTSMDLHENQKKQRDSNPFEKTKATVNDNQKVSEKIAEKNNKENASQADKQIRSPQQIEDLKEKTLQLAQNHNYKEVVTLIQSNSPFTKIKNFDFSSKSILRIIDLSLFTRLEVLNLSFNEISTIQPLGTLPSLVSLDLNKNSIKKIQNLQNYPALKELHLDNNQIEIIEGLQNLSKLQVLGLNHNKIKRIQNVSNLVSLQTLQMNSNELTRIEHLIDMSKLEVIDFSNNEIAKIQGFDGLYKLKWLNLHQNKIKKIENLFSLCSNGYLDISNNPYTKYENEFTLKSLRQRKIQVIE